MPPPSDCSNIPVFLWLPLSYFKIPAISLVHPIAVVAVVLFATVLWTRFRPAHPGSPPVVGYFLPWIGHSIQYGLNPQDFLDSSQKRYGSIFQILLAGRRINILSSFEAIHGLFRDTPKSFNNSYVHYQMLNAIAGLTKGIPYLYEVVDGQLFPIIADCMSKRSLPSIALGFNRHLHERLESVGNHSDDTVTLSELVGHNMYSATSSAVFGPLFPQESYRDFQILDTGIPLILSGIPFLANAAVGARQRLLSQLTEYVRSGWDKNEAGSLEGASDLVSRCIGVLKAIKLSEPDTAGLLLSFMWGLQSNTMRVCFWLMAYLLDNEEALQRVRHEVELALGTEPNALKNLLASDPRTLEGPGFALLDSAVKETMRLAMLSTTVREASCDAEVRGADGQRFLIRKGELVMGNVRAVHFDPGSHPDGDVFKVDRFLHAPSVPQKKGANGNSSSTNDLITWGGGVHLCKGRHFATHEIKVFVIVCLQLYDISPASVALPEVDQRSVGILRTDSDVLVRLRRRGPKAAT